MRHRIRRSNISRDPSSNRYLSRNRSRNYRPKHNRKYRDSHYQDKYQGKVSRRQAKEPRR